jgi:hypothetical protein
MIRLLRVDSSPHHNLALKLIHWHVLLQLFIIMELYRWSTRMALNKVIVRKGKRECCLRLLFIGTTQTFMSRAGFEHRVSMITTVTEIVKMNSTNQRLYTGHTNSEHSFCYWVQILRFRVTHDSVNMHSVHLSRSHKTWERNWLYIKKGFMFSTTFVENDFRTDKYIAWDERRNVGIFIKSCVIFA